MNTPNFILREEAGAGGGGGGGAPGVGASGGTATGQQVGNGQENGTGGGVGTGAGAGSAAATPWYSDWLKSDGTVNPASYERMPDHLKHLAPSLANAKNVDDVMTKMAHLNTLAGRSYNDLMQYPVRHYHHQQHWLHLI